MSEYSQETLELVREAVARVKEADLSQHQPNDNLELDSINRIALIAELENVFNIEMTDSDVEPEIFESLASLSRLIESRRS